jgi:hypothetical protein
MTGPAECPPSRKSRWKSSFLTNTCLLEFDIQQRLVDVVEAILAREPKIVGLGVYIWNVSHSVVTECAFSAYSLWVDVE